MMTARERRRAHGRVQRLAGGYRASQALFAANRLGFFAALGGKMISGSDMT